MARGGARRGTPGKASKSVLRHSADTPVADALSLGKFRSMLLCVLQICRAVLRRISGSRPTLAFQVPRPLANQAAPLVVSIVGSQGVTMSADSPTSASPAILGGRHWFHVLGVDAWRPSTEMIEVRSRRHRPYEMYVEGAMRVDGGARSVWITDRDLPVSTFVFAAEPLPTAGTGHSVTVEVVGSDG